MVTDNNNFKVCLIFYLNLKYDSNESLHLKPNDKREILIFSIADIPV